MSIPYRNTVKRNANFKLDYEKKYIQQNYYLKPTGLWYQIKDCLFLWGELSWGRDVYEIKLKKNILNKPKGILSITNKDDLAEFHNKYKFMWYWKNDNYTINWEKVSNDYGGFEIKNYNKIVKEIRKEKNYINNYTWFLIIDFSSGCIWDLNLIKEIKYSGKY